MSAPRLLDYLAVYGLNEEAKGGIISHEIGDATKENANVITSLRVIVLEADQSIQNTNQFIVYLDLNTVGDKKVWLEVVYGRLKGVSKPGFTPSNPIITTVALFYMPFDDSILQVPEDHNMEPVHIMWGNTRLKHGLVKTEGGVKHYVGQYELTGLLGAKDMQTHKLVLMYRTFTKAGGTELPLTDLRMVSAEITKTPEGKLKRTVKIPDQYEHINFQFGKKDVRFLCYRRRTFHTEKDPLILTFQPSLIEKFPRLDYPDSPLSQGINLFCFPDGVTFSHEPQTQQLFTVVLTPGGDDDKDNETRIYVTCLLFWEQVGQGVASALGINLNSGGKVYVPKVVSLVSRWAFVQRFRQILKQIYRIQMSSNDVPLERVICNLMQEVPLPDQGGTEIQYSIGNDLIVFSRPPAKYLFFTEDVCFEMLFRCLRIDDVITVWTAAMLEKKILFVSTKKSLLTYCAMALASLIFPFKWSYGFIPVLPTQLKNFIEAIFPYIIGVAPNLLNGEIEVPPDAVKVMLDEGRVTMTEFFQRPPEKMRKQLYGRLAQCANLYKKEDGIREAADEAFGFVMPKEEGERYFNACEVRDAFLELQTTLMRNYQRFLLLPSELGQKFTNSSDCFNTRDFLSYHKSNKSDQFLYRLTETQHFVRFIESRCFNSDTNLEHGYFDE